jgi:hypothetical protein
MNNQYVKLIEELDKTISMTRTFWLDARTSEDKKKWYKRIDELLEERMRLMNLRDAA